MNRVALAAFASGLAGALLGAMLGARAVRDDACVDAEASKADSDSHALVQRVAALEHALAAASANERSLAREPRAASALDGGLPSGQAPVLEATVVDLVGKTPRPTDGTRAPAAQRGEGDRYWAQELTMRLGLSPAQTERLRAIQLDLDRQLEHADTAAGDRRPAARRALQQSAEQQLRASLAPRQLAAYEALEPRLKLYPAAN